MKEKRNAIDELMKRLVRGSRLRKAMRRVTALLCAAAVIPMLFSLRLVADTISWDDDGAPIAETAAFDGEAPLAPEEEELFLSEEDAAPEGGEGLALSGEDGVEAEGEDAAADEMTLDMEAATDCARPNAADDALMPEEMTLSLEDAMAESLPGETETGGTAAAPEDDAPGMPAGPADGADGIVSAGNADGADEGTSTDATDGADDDTSIDNPTDGADGGIVIDHTDSCEDGIVSTEPTDGADGGIIIEHTDSGEDGIVSTEPTDGADGGIVIDHTDSCEDGAVTTEPTDGDEGDISAQPTDGADGGIVIDHTDSGEDGIVSTEPTDGVDDDTSTDNPTDGDTSTDTADGGDTSADVGSDIPAEPTDGVDDDTSIDNPTDGADEDASADPADGEFVEVVAGEDAEAVEPGNAEGDAEPEGAEGDAAEAASEAPEESGQTPEDAAEGAGTAPGADGVGTDGADGLIDVQHAEGDGFTVTAGIDRASGLPGDAILYAEELTGEAAAAYLAAAEEALGALSFARFFDIGFRVAGAEVEPAGGVRVAIHLTDVVEGERQVLHFTADGVEILSQDMPEDEAAAAPEEAPAAIATPEDDGEADAPVEVEAAPDTDGVDADDGDAPGEGPILDADAPLPFGEGALETGDALVAAGSDDAVETGDVDVAPAAMPAQPGDGTAVWFTSDSFSVYAVVCAAPAGEPAMPAQRFEACVGNVRVIVDAPEGAFPAETVMTANGVEDADVLEAIAGAVEDASAKVKRVHAVDIAFCDPEGGPLEPQIPLSVVMTVAGENAPRARGKGVSAPCAALVVQVDDEGNASLVDQDELPAEAEAAAPAGTAVAFTAEAFPVYAVVETLETRVITADGAAFRITVTFGPEAAIPGNATLEAAEIPEDDPAYAACRDAVIRSLSDADNLAVVRSARVFDIAIMAEGAEVEPAAPVQVRIEYLEPEPVAAEASPVMVHFADAGVEALEVTADLADDGIAAVDFETSSFSTFAFVQADYIGSLNDQSFAITKTDFGTNLSKAALTSTAHPSNRNRLKGVWVNELEPNTLTTVTQQNGTHESGDDITVWTFEHVREDLYYVKSDDGKYLHINGETLTATAEPMLLEVMPATNKDGSLNGCVFIRTPEPQNGQYYYLNFKLENNRVNFKGSTYSDANSQLTLYAAETLAAYEPVYAAKISACDLEDAQTVVIYTAVWNAALEKTEYYAVDGNGNLVYAFDEGDAIGYRSNTSTLWYVIEHTDPVTGLPNGYFDFWNMSTGKYLAPQSDGVLSDSTLGVVLSGREAGNAASTIEGWDESAWAWVGLQADVDTRTLQPGLDEDSAAFCFARPVYLDPDELHTVETVDSAAAGIRISLYDFSSRKVMDLFDDDKFYENGNFAQGLVQNRLGDDGLPVSCTGRPFSQIYNSGSYKGDANHLFLKETYGATGYYAYSSFDNYAYYHDGEFTVYAEQGTPKSEGGGGTPGSFRRGSFMPFNDIDASRKAINTKLFDGMSDMTSMENPVFDSTLYLTQGTNYYFAYVMEADFLQAKDGLDDKGQPIIYEFTGDDDLWVFVDGVLVLDLGGIHSAVDGSIDFSTGVVRTSKKVTTIRQCFRDAGVFPDGTPWDDGRADDYFKGDTFNDFSGHTMKMFCQERGGGASTLKVRFNLPVVEKGTFAVEKQLLGTGQQKYANVQFAYQAFLETAGGDIPLYPGIMISDEGEVINPASATDADRLNAVRVTYEDGSGDVPFHEDEVIEGQSYDHVFYLKPGEAAVFAGIPEGVRYYVQEINVSGSFYDTVMINETDMGGEGGIGEDSAITARSSAKTLLERQRVIFENKCSDRNIRELRITKHILNPNPEGDPAFEFRVSLEGPNGTLVPYAKGDYYILDPKGRYCVYADGDIVSTDRTELTEEEAPDYVFGKSGNNGSIAGVRDGYTIVVAGLLADTDFMVEEIRLPQGFGMVDKAVDPNSCGAAQIEGADGVIALGKDAQVDFYNRHYSYIKADKRWEVGDYPVEKHGDIQLALYRLTADGEVPADDIADDWIKTVSWPSTTATWNIDLPSGGSLADYVVREVTATDGGVRPVPEGGAIVVAGERMHGSTDATLSTTYLYMGGESGAEKVEAEGGDLYIRSREDTLTNAMPGLSVVKTTMDGGLLAGAHFELQDADGEVLPGYEDLTSGADGVLLADVRLPNGVYYLVETEAPEGFAPLANRLRLTVGGTAPGAAFAMMTDVPTGGKVYDDKTPEDPLACRFEVVNSSGAVLPATGGRGARGYTAAGFALVALALILLLRRRGEDG